MNGISISNPSSYGSVIIMEKGLERLFRLAMVGDYKKSVFWTQWIQLSIGTHNGCDLHKFK